MAFLLSLHLSRDCRDIIQRNRHYSSFGYSGSRIDAPPKSSTACDDRNQCRDHTQPAPVVEWTSNRVRMECLRERIRISPEWHIEVPLLCPSPRVLSLQIGLASPLVFWLWVPNDFTHCVSFWRAQSLHHGCIRVRPVYLWSRNIPSSSSSSTSSWSYTIFFLSIVADGRDGSCTIHTCIACLLSHRDYRGWTSPVLSECRFLRYCSLHDRSRTRVNLSCHPSSSSSSSSCKGHNGNHNSNTSIDVFFSFCRVSTATATTTTLPFTMSHCVATFRGCMSHTFAKCWLAEWIHALFCCAHCHADERENVNEFVELSRAFWPAQGYPTPPESITAHASVYLGTYKYRGCVWEPREAKGKVDVVEQFVVVIIIVIVMVVARDAALCASGYEWP